MNPEEKDEVQRLQQKVDNLRAWWLAHMGLFAPDQALELAETEIALLQLRYKLISSPEESIIDIVEDSLEGEIIDVYD